ncbi:MAG: hypothetical protein EOO54_26525 [Haliea sp.]|nr:MAG: hypothetical protein EOO54_26525 [Haliea sp.]
MNREELVREVERLGAVPGVITCSLVDGQTGMVYHTTGSKPELEALAEAARDYWQLHRRNSGLYRDLGAMLGIVVLHQHGVINVMPCAADAVLVTLAERNRVNFSDWPARLKPLQAVLGDIGNKTKTTA